VSAILSEFMRRVMRFEDAILSFLQSLSSSTELAVYSPAPSLSLSLSLSSVPSPRLLVLLAL